LTPKQLVQRKEDAEEFGGYWIVNGNERVIRLLTAQRRNYVSI
jgi:DNA-directed RNA polymerase I subunit RPA2